MPILGILVAMAAVWAGDGKPSTSKEGRFSATWPGEPAEEVRKVETPRGEISVRYFHLELPDGQYSIQYDDLDGLDPGTIDVQKTLDATIDGFAAEKYYRVLSRKAIVLEGVPGREVEFEVKGDRLPIGNRGRARAFLDKERFYQVIVLGTRESESDRAKAFFDSFAITPRGVAPAGAARPRGAAQGWEKVESAPGRFTALMPPGSSEASEATQATEGAMTYRIAYVDVDAAEARSPKALLDAARKQVVASAGGKLLSEKKIDLLRNPGRELKVETPASGEAKAGLLTCRVYVVGRRVYRVTARGPRDQADSRASIEAFFRSFRPTPGR